MDSERFVIFFVTVFGAPTLGEINVQLTLNYFDFMNVRSAVICTCHERDDNLLYRALSKNRVSASSMGPNKNSETEFGYLFNTPDRLGIMVDGACSENLRILQFASESKNFNPRRVWLVFWNETIVLSDIRKAAEQGKPAMFDIELFLSDEYDGMKHRKRLELINSELNAKLFEDLEQEKHEKSVEESLVNVTISNQMKNLLNVKAMVDSELTIAIPRNYSNDWNLWSVHRKTMYSELEIDDMGRITSDGQLDLSSFEIPSAVRRNDFHGAIMRAGCALTYYTYFNRSDELTLTAAVDRSAQISFAHMKLIEQMLNLRMLIKCFAEYGWPTNGSFNGMIGFLQKNKADMVSNGFILHVDRWNAVDYVDGTSEFRLGMVFRQPPLSQVANIFIMPFSSEVWLALTALLVVTGAIFYAQLRMTLSVNRRAHEHLGDVVSLLSGAMCQQGYHFASHTLATRALIAVVLISTIFFFTSYTATIVALLQSPSHLINSLEAFVDSPLGIGVEDTPYERVFFEEDSHEVVKELYAKKVAPQGENAYLQVSEGTEKVRNGLFAFQGELVGVYNMISSTYTESEKCGLEEMELFPNKLHGPAVPKKSPYREIFAGRMRWLREVGITDRFISRWSHKKPKCESRNTGFSSIGITDIRPLIDAYFYGLLLAIVVLLLEILFHEDGKLCRMTRVTKIENIRKRRRNEMRDLVFY